MICFVIKKTFDTTILEAQTQVCSRENQSHHQEDFRHDDLWGCSGVVGVVSYFQRHTYNYSDNGERTLISRQNL